MFRALMRSLQGYSFKVVTNLVGPDVAPSLQLSQRNDRLNLLAKLKSHAEAAEGIEKDADDDGLPKKAAVAISRKTGTLAALSGADAEYREFATGAGAAKLKGPSIRKLVNSGRR